MATRDARLRVSDILVREKYGSIKRCSDQLGINRTTLLRALRGERGSADLVARIEAALGAPISRLRRPVVEILAEELR